MNETAEQNESPDAADSSSSSNFLDKAKNFITLGGDKKKWTRVLIISAIVIAIMGIASLMIWGIALWALARATAEPNSNDTCISGSPQPTTDKITIDGKDYTIPDSGSGKISAEDHLVTTGDPKKNPSSTSDGIQDHLRITNFSQNCTGGDICNADSQRWTPAEGGGAIGQGSVAIGSIPTSDEPWVMNARWKPMPKAGTRVIITAKKIGKSIVTVAGYEYGPSASTGNVAGAQKEVLAKLGISHGDQITFGFAQGQSLVPGTVYIPGGSSNPCGQTDFTGPGMIYDSNAFTASQIDNYLKNKSPKSPLNGKGSAFVSSGKKYGVNPGFLLGLANAESSLGLQCISGSPPAPQGLGGSNNAFGLTHGGQHHFITFSSYEEGIDRAAKNVASLTYKRLDGTPREFRLKWCGYETELEKPPVKLSDGTSVTYACQNGRSNWVDEVTQVMKDIK